MGISAAKIPTPTIDYMTILCYVYYGDCRLSHRISTWIEARCLAFMVPISASFSKLLYPRVWTVVSYLDPELYLPADASLTESSSRNIHVCTCLKILSSTCQLMSTKQVQHYMKAIIAERGVARTHDIQNLHKTSITVLLTASTTSSPEKCKASQNKIQHSMEWRAPFCFLISRSICLPQLLF